MKKRVFILEPTRVDVSAAEEFGDITYVFGQGERRVSIWNTLFAEHTVASMENVGFDPTTDCFAVVGHLVPLTLALIALLKKHQAVNILLYSAIDRCYLERTVNVNDGPGSIFGSEVTSR